MKRFVGFTLFFSGIIFSFFILNILLYMFNPAYHKALEYVVNGNNIPVVEKNVEISRTGSEDVLVSNSSAVNQAAIMKDASDEKESSFTVQTSVSGSKDASDEKPAIIDKEYHEDCGSEKGYWIIRYEDGSVGIE